MAVSTGGYDMVLMAACRDDDHVLDLVSERLRRIPGVDGLDVITVLKETKDAYRYFGAIELTVPS